MPCESVVGSKQQIAIFPDKITQEELFIFSCQLTKNKCSEILINKASRQEDKLSLELP